MPNLVGESNNPNVAAVLGNNTDGGMGVAGYSISGWGTSGRSETSTGVAGLSTSGTGVVGGSQSGTGIHANSSTHIALYAEGGGVPPVLVVKHISSGRLITGLDRTNNEVFLVFNNGDVRARQFVPTSDKNTKENFSSVNTLEILDNLASMPIQSWNYKEDSSSKRHIGPTAQDFHAAFGLNGDDNRLISSIDLQGVALAAIQGLNEKLKAENAQLHASLANLEARLSVLESKG
ncbi:tail fiber domain-containing protein [Brevibacillus laterosporus]|uniref:tail fiber domain-containing protein n=1 Tax=Brevibacillus laterosporus TaxID=1465 RepID=UPI002654DC4E|nr:tail fiber domain-containing protein [Brevibacillus laterosporus]MDN9012177.1 tail fiber domain-containing protein [Brevibacillus laterosporus]MDO0943273.1 tail fiber domain-containing protein [Brevibacillus laterosporus]